MRRCKTLEEMYKLCVNEGEVRIVSEVNIQKVKDTLGNAETNINAAQILMKAIGKQNKEWMNVYIYESLRGLIEAYILFDGIEADSHQCKNAYICFKHPELELDWDFLETIRLKRNAINYRGQLLKYDDWKPFKMKFELHINLLKEKIEEKLIVR